MLLGQVRLFLDDKHRLVIPEAFREQFGDAVYVTHGFEQNLLIMSESEFQEMYQRVAGLNIADPLARLLQRLLLGHAAKIELNASGRMRLSQDCLDFAGLEKELVLDVAMRLGQLVEDRMGALSNPSLAAYLDRIRYL